MWQTVSGLAIDLFLRVSGLVELVFPIGRQRQVTLAITLLLFVLGIFLVTFIFWADVFYA